MRALKIAALTILLVAASSLAFAKVRVDFDPNCDFSKYRTFMWLERPQTEDPFMADRIVDAVNLQLRVRGLQEVTSNADLEVRASSVTREVPIYNTYYNGFGGWGYPGWGWGWGWGYGGPTWATTTVDFELEATTTVALIDSDTEKAVWKGVSQGDISDKPDKAAKKTSKNIGKMFERFPYGS
jgi:hypothetical protein